LTTGRNQAAAWSSHAPEIKRCGLLNLLKAILGNVQSVSQTSLHIY
jgi:hypothetical protein